MAEAVKNNGRKRRPPSHLREGYHEDNYDNTNNPQSASKDPFKGAPDLCPMPAMARLLTRFLNSANKKLLENRLRPDDDQSSLRAAKQPPGPSTVREGIEKKIRDERYGPGSKGPQASSTKPGLNKQQAPKHPPEKGERAASPITVGGGHARQPRNQISGMESAGRDGVPRGKMMGYPNIGSMSRQQIIRLMPREYSPALMKQQFLVPGDTRLLDRLSGRFTNPRKYEFRQGTKLFKRASFHVGIAYNIHVDNIRQRNPNFSPEQLDPTSVARRFKEENERIAKRQEEEQKKALKQMAINKRSTKENPIQKEGYCSTPGQQPLEGPEPNLQAAMEAQSMQEQASRDMVPAQDNQEEPKEQNSG